MPSSTSTARRPWSTTLLGCSVALACTARSCAGQGSQCPCPAEGEEDIVLQRIEMDNRFSLADQLSEEVGPVILINTFKVPPEDAQALLEAWAADAAYLKTKPGFISTQLHRGIAGSG